MEFKCKYCNGTKYRQISVMVKQCEECGRQIASEGVVDDKLDFSEERKEEEVNLNEMKYGASFTTGCTGCNGIYNTSYYIDSKAWFI